MGDKVREVVRSVMDREIRLVELEFRPRLRAQARRQRRALRFHFGTTENSR